MENLKKQVAELEEVQQSGTKEKKRKGYLGLNKEPHMTIKDLEKKFGEVALISADGLKGVADLELNQLYAPRRPEPPRSQRTSPRR